MSNDEESDTKKILLILLGLLGACQMFKFDINIPDNTTCPPEKECPTVDPSCPTNEPNPDKPTPIPVPVSTPIITPIVYNILWDYSVLVFHRY